MGNKSVFTKILAIVGTVLVWLPVLAPSVFAVPGSVRRGAFMFDYLLPAELFPLVLVGGGLLLWAAQRARSQRRHIGWGLGIAIVSLAGSQAGAILTGLDSGASDPTGWRWELVLALIAIYAVAIVFIGIGGILLWGNLNRPTQPPAPRT